MEYEFNFFSQLKRWKAEWHFQPWLIKTRDHTQIILENTTTTINIHFQFPPAFYTVNFLDFIQLIQQNK